MDANTDGAAEAALIEKVILALANMRVALDWFAEPRHGAAADRPVGLARLDRQLEEVEDAAWRVLAALQHAPQAGPEAAAPPPVFTSRRG